MNARTLLWIAAMAVGCVLVAVFIAIVAQLGGSTPRAVPPGPAVTDRWLLTDADLPLAIEPQSVLIFGDGEPGHAAFYLATTATEDEITVFYRSEIARFVAARPDYDANGLSAILARRPGCNGWVSVSIAGQAMPDDDREDRVVFESAPAGTSLFVRIDSVISC